MPEGAGKAMSVLAAKLGRPVYRMLCKQENSMRNASGTGAVAPAASLAPAAKSDGVSARTEWRRACRQNPKHHAYKHMG